MDLPCQESKYHKQKMMEASILFNLEKTTGELIEIISSLGQEELNETPFEGSWTAGQVGSHLLKSYGIIEILNRPLPKTKRPAGEKIEQIKAVFLNFDTKFKSSQIILPSDDPIDQEILLNALKERIAQIKEVIQTKDLAGICERIVVPGFGELTRLEWLHLILYHTQRHIHQLIHILNLVQKIQFRPS